MFVDTETTGVPVDQTASYKNIDNWPTIKQIAWIIYNKDGQLESAYNFAISEDPSLTQSKPHDYVPAVIMPIHKILGIFQQFLYCDVIVGHNIRYDVHKSLVLLQIHAQTDHRDTYYL